MMNKLVCPCILLVSRIKKMKAVVNLVWTMKMRVCVLCTNIGAVLGLGLRNCSLWFEGTGRDWD